MIQGHLWRGVMMARRSVARPAVTAASATFRMPRALTARAPIPQRRLSVGPLAAAQKTLGVPPRCDTGVASHVSGRLGF